MRLSNRGFLTACALASTIFAAEVTHTTSSSLSGTTTSSGNIGDYIAAGIDLEKVDTDTAPSNSYTFPNATSSTSLLSLTTGGAGSLSTPYANNTLESVKTKAKSSNAPPATPFTGGTPSNYDKSPDGVSNASLLLLATAGIPSNSTTSSRSVLTASLFLVDTAGAGSLNTSNTNNTLRGGNTVMVTSTTWITSCRASSTDVRGLVVSDCDSEKSLVTKTFTNTTWTSATNVDDCWTDWVSYWSMHKPMPATIDNITKKLPVTTVTETVLRPSVSQVTDRTITSTIVSTAPTEAVNGGFTTTMAQTVVTYVTVLTSYRLTSMSTSLYTWTKTPERYEFPTISASNDPNWPPPICTLPTVYPDCQSQWEEYATHNAALGPRLLPAKCEFDFNNISQSVPACYNDAIASADSWSSYVKEATSPICSQASITGALCTSLKDAYLLGNNFNLHPMIPIAAGATFSSGSYSLMNPAFTGWTWPASQPFAPGCTLGCGRCAVTGGSIELLYFPPGMTPHPATGPVVATTLGTVLTSPTYYISFASIYASDVCSAVGPTLESLILPIPTDQPLSTLFASTVACDARHQVRGWLPQYNIGTAAMNVTDLMHEPVPYSIYSSQPYCVNQAAEARQKSGCGVYACPTTLPYRPLVVLSSQLLNSLNPAWGACSLDLRGLYDPPKALQPATAVVVPTMAGPSPTTSATPADPPAGATPEPTALPEQHNPTPSQTPDSPPEPTLPSAEAPKPTPNEPPPVAGQTSDELPTPTSPSAEVSKTTPNNLPPETSQRISADPAGAIISLIVGLTSQKPAANPETPVPGGTVIQPPAAQDSAKPPAEGTGSPPDPQNDPANPNPPPVASAGGGGSDDSSQPSTPNGSGGQAANSDPTVISAGSQLITATPGKPLVVAGTTITSNVPVVVDGHTLSSGSVGLVVDRTSVIALPGSGGQTHAAEFTIGSQTFTASAADAANPSTIVLAGTTLSRGGPAATINGAVVSVGSAGVVVDGTRSVQLSDSKSSPTAAASRAILTVGSSTITAILATGSNSAIVVDGTTLSQGGPAVTVDGTLVSAGTAGLVVDGAQTIPISDFEPTAASVPQDVLTLGDSAITAFAASGTNHAIVIDGTTLLPGDPAITVDGTKFSVETAGLIVDGTWTIPLSAAGSRPTSMDGLQTVLTIGDSTITAVLPSGSGRAIVVNGTTLSPGGSAVTVDGTELSAGTAGLVIGGTNTVSPKTTMGGPQSTDGSGTGAPDAPTATDLGSTSASGQSGALRAKREWSLVLFGICVSLGVAFV